MVNLAKTVLSGVDRKKLETPVQTETLCLLLETLIDLGTPDFDRKIGRAAEMEIVARKTAIDGV